MKTSNKLLLLVYRINWWWADKMLETPITGFYRKYPHYTQISESVIKWRTYRLIIDLDKAIERDLRNWGMNDDS